MLLMQVAKKGNACNLGKKGNTGKYRLYLILNHLVGVV